MVSRFIVFVAASILLCARAPSIAQPAGELSATEELFLSGLNAYTQHGDKTVARDAFLQVLDIDPEHTPALYNLALLAEDNEKWGEAARYYTRYLESADPDDLYIGLAKRKVPLLRQFEDLDTSSEGKSERVYLQLILRGQSALVSGNYGAALALGELASEQQSNRFEGHLLKAVTYMELEQFDEVKQAIILALEFSGPDEKAEILSLQKRATTLGGVQSSIVSADKAFIEQDFAAAGAQYARAWTLSDSGVYGLQAARAWKLAGEPAKAESILKVLVSSEDIELSKIAEDELMQTAVFVVGDVDADSFDASRVQKAIALKEAGKNYEAEAELSQMLNGKLPESQYSSAFYERGEARYKSKDYNGALRDYSMALILDPDSAKYYVGRARALAQLGRYYSAAGDINSAMERADDPRDDMRSLRNQYLVRARQ